MASVSAKAASDVGKLDSVNVQASANGVTIREQHVQKRSKNGMCNWEPSTPKDSMVFDDYDRCMSYLGECLKPLFAKSGEKAEKE